MKFGNFCTNKQIMVILVCFGRDGDASVFQVLILFRILLLANWAIVWWRARLDRLAPLSFWEKTI